MECVFDFNLMKNSLIYYAGCGLARLPLEIAGSGYTCQANEFSVYMLMASHFMLNGIYQPDAFEIFPWIERVSNIDKLSDVLSGVLIPDNAAIDVLNKCPYAGLIQKYNLSPVNSFKIYPKHLHTRKLSHVDPAPVPPPVEPEGRSWLPRFSMAAGNNSLSTIMCC